MSERKTIIVHWWKQNAIFLKAWLVSLIVFFALQVVAWYAVVNLGSELLGAAGVENTPVRYIANSVYISVTFIASFFVFRGVVRRLILPSMNREEKDTEQQAGPDNS